MTPKVRAGLVRQALDGASRARFCEIVGLLLEDDPAAERAAGELGISSSHVRNLARVRQHLVPDAWRAFELGHVSLKGALRLSAMLPGEQRQRVAPADRRSAEPRSLSPRKRGGEVLPRKSA